MNANVTSREEQVYGKIEAVLNNYFQAWNDSFVSKSGEKIRVFMSLATGLIPILSNLFNTTMMVTTWMR
ncbi:hypothetical protein SAMN05421743_102195 [Thalassobacillus cyri]|uniref:Uncharacterized protein n=1 Tax=Thalassobacillus cyri TaxID=571932 RepID=A0A1H3XM66_9BACI|nr:hypothetical protein [Thalassobacillus cyri]SEA00443.1 hypothetical protein SAMN05421743_102195 [Thalassobacillus cyri]